MQDEDRDDKRARCHSDLDVFADQLQALFSNARIFDEHLYQGLTDARVPRPRREDDSSMPLILDERPMRDRADVVVASQLPAEKKWRIQEQGHEWARMLSRVIAILGKLPADFVNRELDGSYYLSDRYVVARKHILWSRLSGGLIRWATRRCTESVLQQLCVAVELLEDQDGVEVTIGTMPVTRQGYVRLSYTSVTPLAS